MVLVPLMNGKRAKGKHRNHAVALFSTDAMSLGGALQWLGVLFRQKKENWTFCEFWKTMKALFVAEKLGKHRSGMEAI